MLCEDDDRTLTENSFMYEKIMPLTQAVEGYDLFNNMKVQKVIFDPSKWSDAVTEEWRWGDSVLSGLDDAVVHDVKYYCRVGMNNRQ